MSATDASPRVAPLQPPHEPGLAEQLARWMPPGADVEPLALFRTLYHHAELAARMRPLGAGILGRHATVPVELRELMIDRTCALTGAEYEWGVHAAAFGALAGLDEERLHATVRGGSQRSCWDRRQRLVLSLAEELHETSTISAALWAELQQEFTVEQLIELIVTAGWYHVIAYVCNGLAVPLEPWALRFPEAA